MFVGDYQKALLAHPRGGEADPCYRNKEFYLAVVVGNPVEPPYVPQGFLGVDLGMVNLATNSDGSTYKGKEVDDVRVLTDELRAALQAKGMRSAKRHL